jgi:hypothetical protein
LPGFFQEQASSVQRIRANWFTSLILFLSQLVD